MYLLLVFLSFFSLQAAENGGIDLLKQAKKNFSKVIAKLKFKFENNKDLKQEVNEVKKILDNNPSLWNIERFSISLLHTAVVIKSLDLVQYVVGKKVIDDIDAKSNKGKTALTMAVEGEDLEIVRFLFSNGANPLMPPISVDTTPLFKAIHNNFLGAVELFINNAHSFNINNLYQVGQCQKTLLHFALSGHVDIIKFLISKNADVDVLDSTGKSPVSTAIFYGYAEAVKLLIEKVADVNKERVGEKKYTLLHLAALRGSALVLPLLEKGADVNVENTDQLIPLHLAAGKQDEETVKLLVERGSKVNAKNKEGNTPLHIAALKNDIKIIFFLLSQGADCTEKNLQLETPEDRATDQKIKDILRSTRELFEAIEKGGVQPEEIKEILRKGASIYAQNSEGKTAEVLAREKGKTEIEKILKNTRHLIKKLESGNRFFKKYLEEGALIEAFNEEGVAPLHFAVKNNNIPLAQSLLNFGADPHAMTLNGQTVWQLCDPASKVSKLLEQKVKNGKISWYVMGVTDFLSLATIGCAWYEFRQTQKEDETTPCKKTFLQKFCDGVKRKKKTIACLALTLLSSGTSWYFAHRKV